MIESGTTASTELEADICIIGSGPAGISIALELIATGATIVMLAGGGARRESAADQDLHRGVVARAGSHESLDENRRRQFGGASAAWGGRCIPFDPIDLEIRPWIEHSGWPLSYDELVPFYRRALTLCRAGEHEFDSRLVFPLRAREIIAGMDGLELESWHLERWSPPINFAVAHGEQLAAAQNVRVLLDTHLLQFGCDEHGSSIRSATAIAGGRRLAIRARCYVLATGGIENARLLLASRDRLHPQGVGNERGLVGRYYMCHLSGVYAAVAPADRAGLLFEYERDAEGVYCRRRWQVSAYAQRRRQIGNMVFYLDRMRPTQGHRDALCSAIYIAKTLQSVSHVRRLSALRAKLREVGPTFAEHLGVVARDAPRMLPELLRSARGRLLSERRLPSVLPARSSTYFGLYFQAEQVPNPDSRILLSDSQVDNHGMPRALVDLAFTSLDFKTVIEGHRIFVDRFHAARAAQLLYSEHALADRVRRSVQSFNSAAHHLGTTRMASTPSEGVVDATCRVHEIENLYVAGASVFPTGGHANPTLTIVALALRLAARLAADYGLAHSRAALRPIPQPAALASAHEVRSIAAAVGSLSAARAALSAEARGAPAPRTS